MSLTQRTVGHLSEYLGAQTTQGTLGPLLMRNGLSQGDPGTGLSKAKRADAALGRALRENKEQELLDLATEILKEEPGPPSAAPWVVDLVAALRLDGYDSTPTTTETPGVGWSGSSRTDINWLISPIGLVGVPVPPLASDVGIQLTGHSFPTAAGHYEQALDGFNRRKWASSNSQLRSTFEDVLVELAVRRTGSRPSGGGRALDALQKNGDLPAGPNEYLRGLWKMSHPGGSHPGLSDEEDAQHRLYAVSAAVGWLIRSLD